MQIITTRYSMNIHEHESARCDGLSHNVCSSLHVVSKPGVSASAMEEIAAQTL
jgi:hypothetical protein